MYKSLILTIGLSFFISTFAKEISYTDHLKRELKFKQTPKRIVGIAPPAGSMVVTLSTDKELLVGTSPDSHRAINEGILKEFFPYLKKLRSDFLPKEDSVNIETILQLNPELIFHWAHKQKSIKALEAAGLKVAALKYSKLDIARTWLNDIAIVLDNSQKTKEILKWHDKSYEKLIKKTSTIKEKNKPKVLYLLNENLAAGPLSHFQFFMDTAGAKNAIDVKKKFVNIDPEMILLANPDIIWLFGFNLKMTPKSIFNNPLFADINAVKNKRVYKVPVGGDRWDPPNQELPLGLEWYTRTVHPTLLEGSIKESIKNAYPMLYGKSPNKKQLDKILRVNMNKNSADYMQIIK